MTETKSVLLQLPDDLLAEVDAACETDGMKRNAWIRDAIKRKLSGDSIEGQAAVILSAYEHASERNKSWLAMSAAILLENEHVKK